LDILAKDSSLSIDGITIVYVVIQVLYIYRSSIL
jgi:hypothetical protein